MSRGCVLTSWSVSGRLLLPNDCWVCQNAHLLFWLLATGLVCHWLARWAGGLACWTRSGLPRAVRSARQRWREREIAATWFKRPSCVMVRGWVFRRQKGAVMSYGGLNREQSSDAMWVSPQHQSINILCHRVQGSVSNWQSLWFNHLSPFLYSPVEGFSF